MTVLMAEKHTPFAAAVKRVIKEHGATYRSQRARTRVPHSTIVGWMQGIPPSMGGVIAFARGFGLDVNEWLELAGYERLEEATSAAHHLGENRETYLMRPAEEGEEESGRRILLEGIRSLNEELGRPLAISLDESTLADLTPDKARATLAFWQEQARKGVI